jgi:molybdenum-dependent DNA-binding transcriptional regulator ModE
MPNPVIRFTIEFARHSLGSAEIDLLEAIHKTGSLSQAARDLEISYKHAWPENKDRSQDQSKKPPEHP